MTVRTVLHVDMDAFYVSVELLRRPELRGRPVVVGGSGRRGVVAAASYEARRYGVHSAMPSVVARRRCPDAVFLQGDHAAYSATSARVRAVFERFTPLVEPLSLDEAFLDVSGIAAQLGQGRAIAEQIRTAVADDVTLTCSVGVAANKFCAKVASVAAKPQVVGRTLRDGHGIVVVARGEEQAFLAPLPVSRMWGVGPVTLERLHHIGIRTIGDLAAADAALVGTVLGRRQAGLLVELAVGHDDRPVEPERVMKSISHEETFDHDLFDEAEVRRQVVRMSDGVAARLHKAGLGARTITVKARDGDFRTVTRSVTVADPVSTTSEILHLATPLLEQVPRERGFRLLGVIAAKLGAPYRQLKFDDLLPPRRVERREETCETEP